MDEAIEASCCDARHGQRICGRGQVDGEHLDFCAEANLG
jgi:hypothetical protein